MTDELKAGEGEREPQLLQIGAGNIGRGYMAQLFHEAGYRVVFADAVDSIAR